MEIITAKQMFDIEVHTIKTIGISSEVLMERAATALYDKAIKIINGHDKCDDNSCKKECCNSCCCKKSATSLTPPIDHRVLVVAGTGNNGADGVCLARMLHLAGYKVDVIVATSHIKLSSPKAIASRVEDDKVAKSYNRMGHRYSAKSGNTDIKSISHTQKSSTPHSLPKLFEVQKMIYTNLGGSFKSVDSVDISEYTLVVDAVFGIGINKTIKGIYVKYINMINDAKFLYNAHILAVDTPSGIVFTDINENYTAIKELDFTHLGNDEQKYLELQDRIVAEGLPVFVRADTTVTFCRPKLEHALYPSKLFCGEVVVADIGIPEVSVQKSVKNKLYQLVPERMPTLHDRTEYSSKRDYGHCAIIGGSGGKSGAPSMAAHAAVRSGSGLTTCIVPNINTHAMEDIPEVMCEVVSKHPYFTAEDADKVIELCKYKNVIAIGPGLGENSDLFVKKIFEKSTQKLVIDAEALYAVTKESIKHIGGRAILTPHLNEFAKMLHLEPEYVLFKRIELCKKFATENDVFLVQKDADTIIAAPDGTIVVSSLGSGSLSKGGSGDVLAGILAALLAQGYDPLDACKLSCKIQGDATKYAEKLRTKYSVTASDIIDGIGVLT